jgi:hypothetical protein
MDEDGQHFSTFMTEPEVAQVLRCSTSKVRRLRFSGKLSYYPGRPVLIAAADLGLYLDSQRRHGVPHKSQIPPPGEVKSTAPNIPAAEWAKNEWKKRRAREARKMK